MDEYRNTEIKCLGTVGKGEVEGFCLGLEMVFERDCGRVEDRAF